jgi:hypothetical protein
MQPAEELTHTNMKQASKHKHIESKRERREKETCTAPNMKRNMKNERKETEQCSPPTAINC